MKSLIERFKYIIILFFLFSNLCLSQKYSKIEIYNTSPEIMKIIARSGAAIEESFYNTSINSLELTVSDRELVFLRKSGIKFNTIIPDISVWFKERNAKSNRYFFKHNETLPKGFSYGSMGGYPKLTEYIRMLDTIALLYPGFVKPKKSIGKTYEGRDIYLLQISNYSSKSEKKKTLYTGLHHAREGASLTTPLYYICYLLENYNKNPIATYLLDNRELFFIPMLNPDGYAYNENSEPNGGGMWRKNRTPYNGEYGVDLNRNYSYFWGFDTYGSNPSPWYDTFRGPAPFSELETQAIKNLCESINFSAAINYHTFGNYIIYPWGYINSETADSTIYRYIAKKISKINKYVFGNANSSIGYFVNGDSDDWMYGDVKSRKKIFAFTMELGTGSDYFWAPIERIKPIAEENIFANNYTALISGAFVDSVEFSGDSTIVQGDTAFATFRFINHGLDHALFISAEVSTKDPFMVINDARIDAGKIESMGRSDSITFKLAFTKETPNGYTATYKIKLFYAGYPFEKTFTLSREKSSPVEYTFIDVYQKNNKAVISWKTESEERHNGFFIQRKFKSGEFKDIGIVASNGLNGSVYYFEDFPNESGEYIYRLKTFSGEKEKFSEEKKLTYKLIPLRYSLSQNFPNPGNPQTSIRFSLPENSRVELNLYNILGQKILILLDEYRTAGEHTISVNLETLSSQIYFYELKTEKFRQSKKMIILK